MVNNDPGAQQYEYDWQNPNKKSFEVGRVVSNTFKVLRENPTQFFLLTFIAVGLPMMALSMWPLFLLGGEGLNLTDTDWIDDFEWEGVVGVFVLLYLVYIAMILVVYGAIVKMTVNSLNERQVKLGESIKSSLGLLFPLLGLSIIYMVCVLFGFLLLIIPGFILSLGWALSFHVKIIEGRSITESLSRSWDLSKGYKRWILLTIIILSVIGAVVGLAFSIPVAFFGNSQTALLEGGATSFWIANAIATGLSQMASIALSYVGLTATYLEIRRVKEGVDTGKVADIFG